MQAVRIAQFNVAEGRREEVITSINEMLIPRMKGADGFESGYWLLDEGTSDGFAVTVWASEDARSAFGQQMKAAMEASGAITGTTIRDLPLVAAAQHAG